MCRCGRVFLWELGCFKGNGQFFGTYSSSLSKLGEDVRGSDSGWREVGGGERSAGSTGEEIDWAEGDEEEEEEGVDDEDWRKVEGWILRKRALRLGRVTCATSGAGVGVVVEADEVLGTKRDRSRNSWVRPGAEGAVGAEGEAGTEEEAGAGSLGDESAGGESLQQTQVLTRY
jgi:hypothetical protein